MVQGAAYCHRCGASFGVPIASKDHFKTGLLLIRIGAVLAATLPLLTIAGVNIFSGGAFLNYVPGMAVGILAVIIGMGVLFGAIAVKFHNDIAAGRHERIVHAMILAAVMFFLGSNIAGIVVGIGAFLCYSSPRKMAPANA
jgi:dihydrodipicolinate synthase/N-acetylneuraminate lyase